MVTDTDNNALLPLPPLLPRFEQASLRAGGGSSMPGQCTPPSAGIILQPGTRKGGVSSLTSSTPVQRSSPCRDAEQAGTPHATPLRRSPRRKSPAGGGSSDDNVLSPHVPLPNLAARSSDNDSVASADDSVGWARESERVIAAFAAQAEAEMAINDAEDAQAWGEIDQWIVFPDANAEIEIPPPPPPQS
jgi:hypothetical protein